MLTGLGLRNFKAFGDEMQEAPLSKITLIYGPNSGGKSSIIQALLLLRQSLDGQERGTKKELLPIGDYVDLGGIPALIHKHNTELEIGLKLKYNKSSLPYVESAVDMTFTAERSGMFGTIKDSSTLFKVIYQITLHGDELFKSESKYRYDDDDVAWESTFSISAERVSVAGESKSFKSDAENNEFLPELILSQAARERLSLLRTLDRSQAELPRRRLEAEKKLNEARLEEKAKLQALQPKENILRSLRRELRQAEKDEQEQTQRVLEEFQKASELDLRAALNLKRELQISRNIMQERRQKFDQGQLEFVPLWDELRTARDLVRQRAQELREEEELSAALRNAVSRTRQVVGGSFRRSHPAELRGLEPRETLAMLPESIPSDFEQQVKSLTFLGPMRNQPERFYAPRHSGRYSAGLKGEFTPHIIYRDDDVKDEVNRWFSEFEIPYILETKQSGDVSTSGENIVVELIDNRTNTPVTIADVGFGISCILPIIVEGVASPGGSIICVEQPELHLHPRLQADLTDLMIDTIADEPSKRKQWIVETHSELLARRIQTKVAQGEILPSDVSVLYVDPDTDGNGSMITKMNMENTGEWAEESWPDGFFDEGYREVMDVVEARLKRTARQRMSREKQKEILEKRRARDGSN